MRFCYIDESGDTGMLPGVRSKVQPVLVVLGLFVPDRRIVTFTRGFVELK